MSVVSKISELGKMRKRDLLFLQHEIENKQLDLDIAKDELIKSIEEQRGVVQKSVEDKREDDERNARAKLENLEKTYRDKTEMFKDNLETLKAIAQIFKIREDRKTSAQSRFYGFCGVFISLTGIGLAYGSDMFGTLVNKKTFEAAKTAISRFIPKF